MTTVARPDQLDLFGALPAELTIPRSGSLSAVADTPTSDSAVVPAGPGSTPVLLDADVTGRPRPKGSMKHIGRGRLVEQLKHSPGWRRAIAIDVHGLISDCDDPKACIRTKTGASCPRLQPGYPSSHAADVRIALLFPPLKSMPVWLRLLTLLPVSRATGDIDKHSRNVLDALQDAGVLKDDSQVIDMTVSKRYCTDADEQGVRLRVIQVGTIERGKAVLS